MIRSPGASSRLGAPSPSPSAGGPSPSPSAGISPEQMQGSKAMPSVRQ